MALTRKSVNASFIGDGSFSVTDGMQRMIAIRMNGTITRKNLFNLNTPKSALGEISRLFNCNLNYLATSLYYRQKAYFYEL